MPHQVSCVYGLQRSSPTTNQRISFDIEPSGAHLVSGGQDGTIRWYDLRTGEQVSQWKASCDCLSSVSINPIMPLLAWGSGEREFDQFESDDDDDESAQDLGLYKCALEVWELPILEG